jgi:hypothetical protein
MGESHGNGRTPMRIWRSQRSHLPHHCAVFCFRFFASFVSPSASSLIQFFSIILDVRHIPRTMVLIQNVSAWENVVSVENLMSIGESHRNERTPMRI